MSNLTITAEDLAKLINLAVVIIPGTASMPSVTDLGGFGNQLQTAVKACGYSDAQIRATLEALRPKIDWSGAKALAADQPEKFHIASTLVSAAYFMVPEVLARLGYPIDRQHPADLEEFVAEYETGILDAVTARGPRYRDAGAKS